MNARAVIPEVLALVQAGRLHPEVVNSALVPWEDAHEVILADQRKPVFVRDHPASRPGVPFVCFSGNADLIHALAFSPHVSRER